ncbi:hypothetical protein STEG23_009574, partial [Scotinomys teguina]
RAHLLDNTERLERSSRRLEAGYQIAVETGYIFPSKVLIIEVVVKPEKKKLVRVTRYYRRPETILAAELQCSKVRALSETLEIKAKQYEDCQAIGDKSQHEINDNTLNPVRSVAADKVLSREQVDLVGSSKYSVAVLTSSSSQFLALRVFVFPSSVSFIPSAIYLRSSSPTEALVKFSNEFAKSYPVI